MFYFLSLSLSFSLHLPTLWTVVLGCVTDVGDAEEEEEGSVGDEKENKKKRKRTRERERERKRKSKKEQKALGSPYICDQPVDGSQFVGGGGWLRSIAAAVKPKQKKDVTRRQKKKKKGPVAVGVGGCGLMLDVV